MSIFLVKYFCSPLPLIFRVLITLHFSYHLYFDLKRTVVFSVPQHARRDDRSLHSDGDGATEWFNIFLVMESFITLCCTVLVMTFRLCFSCISPINETIHAMDIRKPPRSVWCFYVHLFCSINLFVSVDKFVNEILRDDV